MKIPANRLYGQLETSLLPCYLVTGDEPLIVQESLDAIRAAARGAGFSTRERFVQTTGFDWKDLEAAGGNLSLFADKRIIDLTVPTGKPGKAGGAAIVNLAERTGDDLLFVVNAPKLERRSQAAAWVKALESRGALVQVWPVGPRDLPAWIAQRMQSEGLRPDRDATRLIAERVEGNLLAAQQEIEKLGLLLGEGAVAAADVERAVADSSRYDVYKLADAAVAGDARRALRILGGLRDEGVDAVIVVWALTRELRVLAGLAERVRDGVELGAAMQKQRVWSSRQGIVRVCVGRHDGDDFHRLIQAARRADAAAKGQLAADPWQLAAGIVVELAGARARAA